MERANPMEAIMNIKGFFTAKNIAYLAVLLSLVVVLQAVGGSVSFGLVSLNFTLIPIVIGAILFGAAGGAFLGLACGIVVLVQVIFGGGFYAVIWAGNPVITFFTCVLKTTVAGFVAGLVYGLLAKKNKYVATFVAAGLVPVINTALFILGCLCMSSEVLAFRDFLVNDAGMAEYAGMNPFIFILLVLVTFNFFIEFALNLVLAPAIVRVVAVVEKTVMNKKKIHRAEVPGEVSGESLETERQDTEQNN